MATNDPELLKLILDYKYREIVNIERHVNREVLKYVNIVNIFNSEKVLRLYWHHQGDVISLEISEIFKEAVNIVPTKRNILSIIASVVKWNIYKYNSDASNPAYAADVYIKAVRKYGNISVTFVASKLRIVPLNKSISIPRLELLWNFILANLIRSVYNLLSEEIFIEELICWTDSFISLSWIKAVNQEFK